MRLRRCTRAASLSGISAGAIPRGAAVAPVVASALVGLGAHPESGMVRPSIRARRKRRSMSTFGSEASTAGPGRYSCGPGCRESGGPPAFRLGLGHAHPEADLRQDAPHPLALALRADP